MTEFRFSGFDKNGKKIRGVLGALDKQDAHRRLVHQGIYSDKIVENVDWFPRLLKRYAGPSDAETLRSLISRLAILLEAKLSVEEALKLISHSSPNRVSRQVFQHVHQKVLEGMSLADALQSRGEVVPRPFVTAIRAAEKSSTLQDVFADLSKAIEEEVDLVRDVKSALIYPMIILAIAVAMCGYMAQTIVPKVAEMFETRSVEMPWQTELVLMITNFNLLQWSVSFAALLILFFALRFSLRPIMRVEFVSTLMLRLPFWGRFVNSQEAERFTKTLALLIRNKIASIDAVAQAGEGLMLPKNRRSAAQATEKMRMGASVHHSLQYLDFLDVNALDLIRTGEQASNLSEAVEKVHKLSRKSVSASKKRIVMLIEPLAMLIAGAVVLFVVSATLLPIFRLQQSFSI